MKIKRVVPALILVLAILVNITPAAAAVNEEVLRSSTFELTDPDFGNIKTDTAVSSNLLDSKSASQMTMREYAGSRWVEVSTKQNVKGGAGLPFDKEWTAQSGNCFTMETSMLIKDKGSDYVFQIISGDWSLTSELVTFAKDGKIYARSSADSDAQMAARADWKTNQPYRVRIVCHMDTLSYDFYLLETTKKIKLVENEPMENKPDAFSKGIVGFYCQVPELRHASTSMLLDNIKITKSDKAGRTPEVNPDPSPIRLAEEQYGEPTSWYVSPTGNDGNDGKSPQRPLKTPQVAADRTNPGDTVYFMDGMFTYNGGGTMLQINNSGAPGAYITYTNYPGATPIFKAYTGWNHIVVWASYIKLEGLTIEGNSSMDLIPQAEMIYEETAKAQDGAGPGVDNLTMSTTNTNGVSFGGREMLDKGISVIHHLEMRNCTIRNCTGGGFGATLCDYVTVEDNEIYNNCWTCMYATSGISVLGLVDIDNNTNDYKIILRNNKVYNNITWVKWLSVRRHSDGNGIIIDSTLDSQQTTVPYYGKILVANNLCAGNGGSGIHAFRGGYTDVVNNTLYKNSANPNLDYPQMFSSQSVGIRFINNIVYGREDKPLISNSGEKSTTMFANNLYYNGTDIPTDIQNYNYIMEDPQFIDPDNYDFRLKETSPAIDQGLKSLAPDDDHDHDSRPQGGGYDLGAYETEYTSDHPLTETTMDVDALIQAEPFAPKTAETMKGTPKIDGEIDGVWDSAQKIRVNKVLMAMTEGQNATAIARTLWDEENLYVLVEVTDNLLSATSEKTHEQDSVEIFVDENEARTNVHDEDDGQYRVNYLGVESFGPTTDEKKFTSSVKVVDGGYIVEAAIKLKAINPMVGVKMGFEVQINDDMGAGVRAALVDWCDPDGNGYGSSAKWGQVKLVDKISSEYAPEEETAEEPSGGAQTDDENAIKIMLDGEKLVTDVPPIMVSDRVLVPMRAIFEALGAEVKWDDKTQTVTGTKGDDNIVLQIGNPVVQMNGEQMELDVPAMLQGERTMVPIRFIAESLKANVDWIDESQTVLITSSAD